MRKGFFDFVEPVPDAVGEVQAVAMVFASVEAGNQEPLVLQVDFLQFRVRHQRENRCSAAPDGQQLTVATL